MVPSTKRELRRVKRSNAPTGNTRERQPCSSTYSLLSLCENRPNWNCSKRATSSLCMLVYLSSWLPGVPIIKEVRQNWRNRLSPGERGTANRDSNTNYLNFKTCFTPLLKAQSFYFIIIIFITIGTLTDQRGI